jgi:hypothetical protein
LIPKPARKVPAAVKKNARVVRLAPLEIRSLALTRPGAKKAKAKEKEALRAAQTEILLSRSQSSKTSAVA